MIHRILDFLSILFLVWGGMIFGIWFISYFIVPLELSSRLLTGTLKVIISAGLAFSWLFIWKKIVYIMFWHALNESDKQSS